MWLSENGQLPYKQSKRRKTNSHLVLVWVLDLVAVDDAFHNVAAGLQQCHMLEVGNGRGGYFRLQTIHHVQTSEPAPQGQISQWIELYSGKQTSQQINEQSVTISKLSAWMDVRRTQYRDVLGAQQVFIQTLFLVTRKVNINVLQT